MPDDWIEQRIEELLDRLMPRMSADELKSFDWDGFELCLEATISELPKQVRSWFLLKLYVRARAIGLSTIKRS